MNLSYDECEGALIREQRRLESSLERAVLSPTPASAEEILPLFQQAHHIRVCMARLREEFPRAR
jgi:hypothetical protein